MGYIPFGATVVVRPKIVRAETASGIIKSEEMIRLEKENMDGSVEVVLVGVGCREDLVPGDNVYLQGQCIVQPVMVDGEELLQVEEYAILGKVC